MTARTFAAIFLLLASLSTVAFVRGSNRPAFGEAGIDRQVEMVRADRCEKIGEAWCGR